MYVCMYMYIHVYVGLREAKEKKWSNPPQSYHTHVYVSVGFRLGELAPFTIVRAGLGCKTNLSLTKKPALTGVTGGSAFILG